MREFKLLDPTVKAKILEYWAGEKTAQEIAYLLHISRNSVIGVVKRTRDKDPSVRGKNAGTLERCKPKSVVAVHKSYLAAPVVKEPNPMARSRGAAPGIPVKPKFKTHMAGPELASELRDIYIKMTKHECYFAVGDFTAPPYAFCGKEVKPGSRYCVEHHNRCVDLKSMYKVNRRS
jgi:hypothetical protein